MSNSDDIDKKMLAAAEPAPSRRGVERMFDRIAHRYDFLNHFLSANRDRVWRRQMARHLPAGDTLEVLDLATGTGDQLLALYDSGRVKCGVGLDPAREMLRYGRDKIAERGLYMQLALQEGSAEAIPFPDDSYDTVSISFGIRNVVDVDQALQEMYRVLRSGGRVLILEFSLPQNRFIRWFYLMYFRHVLPIVGRVISGDAEAYTYLNRTVETFPYGEAFCKLMRENGFTNVRFEKLTFGIAAIYIGEKG